jgi:HEPN domain-containing protein
MSMTEQEAAEEEWYNALEQELYEQHKEEAVEGFKKQRLHSYYPTNPEILKKGVLTYQEAEKLLANGHSSASLAFSVSAIEQLIKTGVLMPVIHGLVHTETVAELIVKQVIGRSGIASYQKLLRKLFESLADVSVDDVKRDSSNKPLLEEMIELQKVRDGVIHRGEQITVSEAKDALSIALSVFNSLLVPMLTALDLTIEPGGRIAAKPDPYRR